MKVGKLGELERRLKDEPDNLGLRVSVAGALHEAGRIAEAVELYRSVAIAYRDQGRTQQAIAVCRSILEIVPDDVRCIELLATLVGDSTGARRSSKIDETPLPGPLPYHVADPTTRSLKKLSVGDLPIEKLPASEDADTRPGTDATPPPQTGIANAARRISLELIASTNEYEAVDVTAELDTRQRPRISSEELHKIGLPPPTAPVAKVDVDVAWDARDVAWDARGVAWDARGDDEAPTPPPREAPDTEEELTVPRELPLGTPASAVRVMPLADVTRVREPITNQSIAARQVATAMLGAALFSPLPAPRRAAVLSRFHRRSVRGGDSVIRQGDAEPPLVLVGRGRLEVRVERADRRIVLVESVGTGDYIGEGALLSRTPAPAHVVAATDAELLVLLPHDFYEIAGAFPALWSSLKDMAERRARDLAAKTR